MKLTCNSITAISLSLLVLNGCASNKSHQQSTEQSSSHNAQTIFESSENNYRTNQDCIDVIKKFEGVRLKAYIGPGGHWLIGYGHKAGVFKGMIITPAKAEEILKADLIEVENNIKRLVKVNVNANQFSAMVCLAYNIGWGNFANSTLLRKLNEGDFDEAANQFAVWRMVKGKINQHQVKRRAKERAIFVK